MFYAWSDISTAIRTALKVARTAQIRGDRIPPFNSGYGLFTGKKIDFFFGVKFVSASEDAIFKKKNGGKFFFGKKTKPGGGGGGPRGVW